MSLLAIVMHDWIPSRTAIIGPYPESRGERFLELMPAEKDVQQEMNVHGEQNISQSVVTYDNVNLNIGIAINTRKVNARFPHTVKENHPIWL